MPRKAMNNEALGFGIGRFFCLELDRLTARIFGIIATVL
jgi:hypothetical protein